MPVSSIQPIATIILANVYMLGFLIFFLARRKSDPIRMRLPNVAAVSGSICIIYVNYLIMYYSEDVFFRSRVPCFGKLMFNYAVNPVWKICFWLRLSHLLIICKVNQMSLSLSNSASFKSAILTDVERKILALTCRFFKFGTLQHYQQKHYDDDDSAFESVFGHTSTNNSLPPSPEIPNASCLARRLTHSGIRYIGTPRITNALLAKILMITFLLSFSILGVSLVTYYFIYNRDAVIRLLLFPSCSKYFYYPLIFVDIFCCCFSPCMLILAGRVKEAYFIKWELFIYFASIVMTLFLTSLVSSSTQKLSLLIGGLLIYSCTIVFPALLSICWSIKKESPITFEKSSLGKNNKMDFSSKSFEAVLKDPLLYEEFKKVVAQQLCHENLCFFESYRELRLKYKQFYASGIITAAEASFSKTCKISNISETISLHSHKMDIMDKPSTALRMSRIMTLSTLSKQIIPQELKIEFLHLYQEFIPPNCPQELNISQEIREKVMDRISAGDYRIEVLKPVFEEVYHILFNNSFLSFLKCYQFDDYLSP